MANPVEPALLCDVTGSMNDAAAPEAGSISKRQLATDIIRHVVTALAAKDSQAEDEAGGGGVLTVTFANNMATEVGDLNPTNFDEKWSQVHWGGGTYIVPGLDMVADNFKDEFGAIPLDKQPDLLLGIITDGALQDLDDATAWLANAPANYYPYVLVVGYGPDHDHAVDQWTKVAAVHKNVSVEAVTKQVDADAIAAKILAKIE